MASVSPSVNITSCYIEFLIAIEFAVEQCCKVTTTRHKVERKHNVCYSKYARHSFYCESFEFVFILAGSQY
jgi:hypothetical protein